MIQIAIIDDEQMWRQRAEDCVRKYYGNREITIDLYPSGEVFVEGKKQYDILLVDIELKKEGEEGLTGFETVLCYQEQFPHANTVTIILTTHIELSRQGYHVSAFRYLDKQCIQAELTEALEKAEGKLRGNHEVVFSEVGMGECKVMVKDILYVESEKRNTKVYTKHGFHICKETLGKIEEVLAEYGCYRCHKAYLVNLMEIEKIEKNDVFLSNGVVLHINSKKVRELKDRYMSWRYEHANQ